MIRRQLQHLAAIVGADGFVIVRESPTRDRGFLLHRITRAAGAVGNAVRREGAAPASGAIEEGGSMSGHPYLTAEQFANPLFLRIRRRVALLMLPEAEGGQRDMLLKLIGIYDDILGDKAKT